MQDPDFVTTPGSPQHHSNKRKRSAVGASASSRSVASLTPEQLARKRQNDREAQRAIRERTKTQITRLEDRVRELQSEQPYHDLQAAIQQKEAAERANEDIRRRLTSVIALIQPIVGGQSLNDLATAAQQERDPRAESSTNGNARPAAETRDTQAATEAHWTYPSAAPTSNIRGWSSTPSAPDQSRSNIHPGLQYGNLDERLGVDFILDGNQRLLNVANGVPPESATTSPRLHHTTIPLSQTPIHAYSILPQHIAPTFTLDSIFLKFLAERQQLAKEGASSKVIAGPRYPNFAPLLNQSTNSYSHPLSYVMTDIVRTFPDLRTLPEKVAVVHIMFLIMRWKIEPTRENYDRLPDWLQPRPSQLFTPHPVWFDYLPWPKMRDLMVQQDPWTVFDTFFIPYTTTISVNWPYDPKECLIPAPAQSSASVPGASPHSGAAGLSPHGAQTPDSDIADNAPGGWQINPLFEAHVLTLANWSLGPAFAEQFPELAAMVRIVDT
ncbi:hypothetical protein P152DRAFT_455913 [Eremomyces bilateralis CBS 781.70]|uniref:BZIP transcription factor n=1 Tax=Eremomyces bilateralis CBS 781.70 TaxID=1392243 RepID=A0A6G1GAB3_9PEZI|nr:uncharacterized protein P152DRAFT_455913 [Eremomyces bilateralis CBS 781.70]KAF1814876.1 hypothetical protein P152DRAFT_455913 [Eremomyces bilateralis CBS 781.70]